MIKIPQHIAIIMDGNGRWARKRGLPRSYGHYAGVKAVRRTIEACLDLGVKYLSLFTFSTENWARPKDEVEEIMKLFSKTIREEIDNLKEKKVRVLFMGRLNELPEDVKENIEWTTKETEKFRELTLVICMNYSGRAEIVDAVNKAVEAGKKVDMESIRNFFYIPELPDPDLLIRTSNELRISNFLLYQIAYSEIYISDVLWPDFDKEELLKAIKAYSTRERRFGGI
uniref:Isoprenyl transferase n=1 Tax=candidate division WOR-3 bacterium TaxID=2052148 RepID=A0A7C4YG06_UNCW3